jgi:glutamate--cysteine ligase
MLTYQDLIDDISQGCKSKNEWRIGLEHEQFAFNTSDGSPLAYDSSPGIKELLVNFAEKFNWSIIKEGANPIALTKDGVNLTLEPGGQVEYSGSPLKTLNDAKKEMEQFYTDLLSVADELNIGFLPTGLHPKWSREDIHWMPKARYVIMKNYMEKKGKLGVDMMLRTCGTQINLDYSDEADMVKKFRVALSIQPIVTALMANSHYLEGQDTGYASFRSHIWTDTDNDRCGFLPFVFEEDMSFEKYVDYALDVPMYFFIREGSYINAAGKSFRDFMAGQLESHEGIYPDIKDWRDHLTTLFPEVRLKHYLELRGADSNTPEMVYAMGAFWVGILYDSQVLDQIYNVTKNWPVADQLRIREETPLKGLTTQTPDGQSLCNLAQDILEMLSDSLLEPYRQKVVDCKNLTQRHAI